MELLIEDEERDLNECFEVRTAGKGKFWEVLYRMIEDDEELHSAVRSEYSWTTGTENRMALEIERITCRDGKIPVDLRDDLAELIDDIDKIDYSVSD